MSRLHQFLISGGVAAAAALAVMKVAETRFTRHVSTSNEPSRHLSARAGNRTAQSEHPLDSLRQRSRRLDPRELDAFLESTIIPEVDFHDAELTDVISSINGLISSQIPPGQPRPKVIAASSVRTHITEFVAGDHVFTAHPLSVKDLHLENVPLDKVIAGICEQSRCRFWTYGGNIYIEKKPHLLGDHETGDQSPDFFFHQERLGSVQQEHASLPQIIELIRSQVRDHEYYGQKPEVWMHFDNESPQHTDQMQRSWPDCSINLQNPTLEEIVAEVRRLTGIYGHFHPYDGSLVFARSEVSPHTVIRNGSIEMPVFRRSVSTTKPSPDEK